VRPVESGGRSGTLVDDDDDGPAEHRRDVDHHNDRAAPVEYHHTSDVDHQATAAANIDLDNDLDNDLDLDLDLDNDNDAAAAVDHHDYNVGNATVHGCGDRR